MSLDKKTLALGNQIVVTDIKANTAGIYTDPTQRNLARGGITLYTVSDTREIGAVVNISSVLTVTKLPRKVNGVTLCRVKTKEGYEGEVFWTELKYNCNLI